MGSEVSRRVAENVARKVEVEDEFALRGVLRTGGYVEAQDPDDGGKWKGAAFWARKHRGVRLRNAQVLTGDGGWVVEGEKRVFRVWSAEGAPWIAELIGKHGNRSTYINWECRCLLCCGANGDYGWGYRQGISAED